MHAAHRTIDTTPRQLNIDDLYNRAVENIVHQSEKYAKHGDRAPRTIRCPYGPAAPTGTLFP